MERETTAAKAQPGGEPGYYKHNLLHHFTDLLPALERAGAQATLDLRSFQLRVAAGGRSFVLEPQFLRRENGVRKYVARLEPGVQRFIGWRPYGRREWDIAGDKLKLKAYAAEQGLRTPPYSADAAADLENVVVKKAVSSFAADVRGPFRHARDGRREMRPGHFFERYVPGRAAKIYYCEARPVCLELQAPASLAGDGRRPLRKLLERELRKDDRAPFKAAAEYLEYAGVPLERVLPAGERQQVDFRYGSVFNAGRDLESFDLTTNMPAALAPQLAQIGERLSRAIPAELRRAVVYTVDAVLDAAQALWVLEMNSNPFLHPYVYPAMLEALFRAGNDAGALSASPQETVPLGELFQLAMTQLNSGARDEALALLDRILRVQPAHAPALYYSGHALAQSGRHGEARQRLDALLRNAPRQSPYARPAAQLLAALPDPAIRAAAAAAGRS